jgi:hypothetical protein
MTDRDVIERVAVAFGTSVHAIDKGRYRTEYGARVKGSRAVTLMRDLRPMMSDRRRAAIDAALGSYTPPPHKLDFAMADEIRQRSSEGETVSSLSRSFSVSRPTIRAVLCHRIYPYPPPAPWRGSSYLPAGVSAPRGLSSAEFMWLAGWLEGEGSFHAPPPSSPNLPRISGDSRDRDVISEVARLFGVKFLRARDKRARARGWSPIWRVLKRGEGAARLMVLMEPLMSARRRTQIGHALAECHPYPGYPRLEGEWRRGESNPCVQSRHGRRLQV